MDKYKEILGDQFADFLKDIETNYIAKKDYDTLKVQYDNSANQIKERDDLISGFKKDAKGNEDLTGQIATLQETIKIKDKESADKLLAVQKGYALDLALTSAGAKNPTAVKALLKTDQMTFKDGKFEGLDLHLAEIKKTEGYMFNEAPSFGGSPDGKTTPPKSNDDEIKTFAKNYINGKI